MGRPVLLQLMAHVLFQLISLDRVAHQTILWYDTNHKQPVKRRKHKVFRNPVIQSREMALSMELEEVTKADLARRFGCSRARVTQKLNLLNLPRDLLLEIEALGDNWDRRLVTERGLRNPRNTGDV